MKIPTLIFTFYLLCSWFVHADTYVWEDYDDFSGSSLDTNKWNYITFNGGNQPYISNGKMLLESDGKNLNATPQNEPKWDAFVEDVKQWGDPEVFAYPSTDGIYGLEASLTIPQGIENGTFVDLSFFEVKAVAQEFEMKGLGVGFKYENDTLKISIDTEGVEVNFDPIDASIGRTYKFSITHNNLTYSLFVDDQKVAQVNIDNFEPNLISLSAYNEEEKSFSIEVEEVRVLRKETTTFLDGSVLMLSSTDGVSETLSFENGTFTSTFQDPTEGTFVDTDKSYILDEISSDVWNITLEDGDTYSFDASTNSGTLVDYENGVIDTEGTWSFAFERHDWEDYDDFSSGSLDSSKWELAWFKGGRAPTVVNGALQLGGSGDPNDPASDSMPYQLSLLDIPESMATHPHAIITDSSVYGLEAEIMLPSGSQYSTGLNFLCWDTTSQTAGGSFKQFGPEIEIWADQSPTFEYQYLDALTGERVDVALPANFDTYYKASLIQDGKKSMIFLDGEKVADFHYPEFSPNAYGFFAFNDDGHPFETYVKNVRVLRRSQEITEPDPVTVVSDPNGNAVVVQVGDEYEWSSNLNGVTLWSVDESGGDIQPITMRFENGRNYGNEGFYDSVALPQPYDMPFVIDENGYIKVTEDSDYQYYHVVSVENGVIATLEGDEQGVIDDGVSEADQWFFTTRAAAEAYYYSKVNPRDWLWFDHYPWVYSSQDEDWLYFFPSGGELLYYSSKGRAWRQFN